MLFLLLFSTLIAAFRSPVSKTVRQLLVAAGAAALAAGLHDRELDLIAAIICLWAVTAALLQAMNLFESKHHRVEDLYDALSQSHEELEAARRRLLDYAAQVERHAQAEERSRIARDIHDDLGHRLIRVKMMSEAVLHLFDAHSERARDIVRQMRDQLQDSMELMRRTVRRLEGGSGSEARRYALDRLVAGASADMGIAVSFDIHGMPRPLYPSLELILFKNAQEAITNAVRHGQASAVKVDLAFAADSVSLTVSNNGTLPREPVEWGLGMRGMKERIALLGGKLDWSCVGVFAITTTLPLLGGSASHRLSIDGGVNDR